MKVYNTTHHNPEIERSINQLVGRAYGFIRAIRLGGIGSRRMSISEVSPGMLEFIHQNADVNSGNIELRPGGIIVHLKRGLLHYSWCIPWHQLTIYNSGDLSIHSNGQFVRFRDGYALNKKFVQKLIKER